MLRQKIKVQVRKMGKGEWIETWGYYPKEWLCANPDCNRVTRSYNRNIGRNHGHQTYCSDRCRRIVFARKCLEKKLNSKG